MTILKKTLPIAFAALLATALTCRADVTTRKVPTLAVTLQKVFADWSKAMADGDTKLWQKTTAQYRQNGMRNEIVSQGLKWPDALFETIVAPPNMSAMKLARVMENGPTAQLVYYGKADFGIDSDEVPDGLVFLMFVKQRDGWKFNTLRFMSFTGAEEVADQAAAGLFDFLDVPEFRPPGRVPPLPKLCPIPELVGWIKIISLGYETDLKVADRSEHTVIDNIQKGLIIGGLRRGTNQIIINVKPLALAPGVVEKDAKRHFEFIVFRETPNPDEPLKAIYSSGPLSNPGNFKVIVRGDG